MAKRKINTQWDRVQGPDLDTGKKQRAERNKSIMADKIFLDACANAGIEPTKRQASKWNSKKGKAYKEKNIIG